MEYSKEDLMEAKKQIWGVGENMGTEESKKIWEENAQFWDNAMGDESNEFHREVVRPKVTELLSPNPADYILDIACGNGNYSSYLAQRGASVVAFDYSKKMIELAKRRQSQYAKQIEFCVADATDRKSILELKRNRAFTKAVSNMAIMDITDIEPLFMAVYELLEENGIFVFGNVKKCAVGKHPKSEKHGNTAQFSEVERSGTQEKCGGIGSGCRLRLRPLPVLHRRQSQRVARIDPNAVVVDKNMAKKLSIRALSKQCPVPLRLCTMPRRDSSARKAALVY